MLLTVHFVACHGQLATSIGMKPNCHTTILPIDVSFLVNLIMIISKGLTLPIARQSEEIPVLCILFTTLTIAMKCSSR